MLRCCLILLPLPLLLLLSLCRAQRVGELGLTLPTFKTNPGMLNCVRYSNCPLSLKALAAF
jgi:hypothetical protein